jgi:origin recognition complex subunit 1
VEPLESLVDDTPRKNLDRDGDQHSSRPLSRKRQHRGSLISKDRDQDSQDDDDMSADPKTPTKSRKRARGTSSSSKIEVQGLPASVSRTSPSESSARAPSPLAASVLSSDLGHDDRISSGGQVRAVPHTPSKRGSSKSTITPRRRAAPTPHSKVALKARVETKRRRISQQVASQNTFTEAIDLGHLPKDARLRAMHVLHVGSRPEALPCREEEYTDILGKVLELLEEGAGGCLCELFFTSFL